MKTIFPLLMMALLYMPNLTAEPLVIPPKSSFTTGSYNLRPIYTCHLESQENKEDSSKQDLILKLSTNTSLQSKELLNESIYLISLNDDGTISRNSSNENGPHLQSTREAITYKHPDSCYTEPDLSIKFSEDPKVHISEVIIKRGPCWKAQLFAKTLDELAKARFGLNKPSSTVKCKFKAPYIKCEL